MKTRYKINQKADGKFEAWDTRTWDPIHQVWDTAAEAQVAVDAMNARFEAMVSANKAQAVARRAERGKVMASDMLIDKNAH